LYSAIKSEDTEALVAGGEVARVDDIKYLGIVLV